MDVCACTIASWPMMPSADVVARSFAAHHPEIPFVTLVADRPRDAPRDAALGEMLHVGDLGRPDLLVRGFRAAHAQQFSYALTAALIAHLLARGFDGVLFYKQESLVCGRQDAALRALAGHSVVLTPHLLQEPAGGDGVRRERNVLISGVYNGGFLGVRGDADGRRFLRWWDERLEDHCRHAVDAGMHHEQRWLDFVPSLVERVATLRDPAFNVGHWNMTERAVTSDEDGSDVRVDGRPCALVRFSGYDPGAPDRATRYDERVTVGPLHPARPLFDRYRQALLDEGWRGAQATAYGLDRWEDGTPIPPAVRELHRALPPAEVAALGDPFAVGPGTFSHWLAAPSDDGRPGVPRILRELHAARPDLRAAFPDPLGADRTAITGWARTAADETAALAAARTPLPADRGTAIVSLATLGRLPALRVLARSLRAHHPDLVLRAVVLEGVPPGHDREAEPFELLDLDALGIGDRRTLLLTEEPMALAVRTKAAALVTLLALGHDRVLYLDSDCEVRGSLQPMLDALDAGPILLLPHVVDPLEAAAVDRELIMLKAGTFNAGVLGVRAHPEALAFLLWWERQMLLAPGGDPDDGLYYDQRWLDLVPGLFAGVQVLRDPRFDVAYWNMRERREADWRLLHFSGFDPREPERLTHHGGSFALDEVPEARAACARYAAALEADGFHDWHGVQTGLSFADGTRVPPFTFELLRAQGRAAEEFADPYGAGAGSLLHWLGAASDAREPALSRLWLGLHGLREDLQARFGDPCGADRAAFLAWCTSHGMHEHGLDPAFAPPATDLG